ncbi:WG repeat-containing protein [Spirosoma sp. BT702]|uniref:WG repeat-containing protein n=1 Tax=Spirosoma profusum TaxID=2771354 RepID=A0A927AWL7_9BACT|nr:WG repeat-containing protein [Spirosoma profusum]MBD2705800.1 WG repeat-containing protein [Spirosoma profusum]
MKTIILVTISAFLLISFLWKRYSVTDQNSVIEATPDEISSLPADALYPAPKEGKWGYLNSHKTWVIPPVFEQAEDFMADRAVVAMLSSVTDTQFRFGLIDRSGRLVVPCIYERLDYSSEGMARAQKANLWGYIDRVGAVVIPFQYESAGPFSEGLACVSMNGLNGFIDTQGRLIIPPQFQRLASHFFFNEGRAMVYQADKESAEKAAFIDKTGKFLLSPQFTYAENFREGLAVAQPLDSPYYGFIDQQGKWVIPANRYENAWGFSEGLASVAMLLPDKTAWHWFIIDKKGNLTTPGRPYRKVGSFVEGLAPVQDEQSRGWGFINRQGIEVIPTIYTGLAHFHNGLARMEIGSPLGELKIVYITKSGHVFWRQV